jgi:hypothetical protein
MIRTDIMASTPWLGSMLAELGVLAVGLVVGAAAVLIWKRIAAWRQSRTMEWDPY